MPEAPVLSGHSVAWAESYLSPVALSLAVRSFSGYFSTSTTLAFGAFLRFDSMPFMHAALDE